MKRRKAKTVRKTKTVDFDKIKQETIDKQNSQHQYEAEQQFLSTFVRIGLDPSLPDHLLLSGAYRSNVGMINIVVSIGDIRRAAQIIKRRLVIP